MVVDGVGDQLLAGTGFTAQQDGRIPFGNHADLVEHAAHGGRAADDIIETILMADRTAQAVAFFDQRFLFALDIEGKANAVADQVGHHLDKARAFIEQAVVGRVRLHGQHPLKLPGEADRCGDKRQAPVENPDAIEKTRFIPHARQGNGAFFIKNQSEQPFAGLITHGTAFAFVLDADGVYDEIAVFRVDHRHQTATHASQFVERAQHFAQRVTKVERTRQDFANTIECFQFDPSQDAETRPAHFISQRHGHHPLRNAGRTTRMQHPPRSPVSPESMTMTPSCSAATCCADERPVPR